MSFEEKHARKKTIGIRERRYLGREIKADVEHGGLVGKGGRAVLRKGVRGDLIVDIVAAQTPNDHLHQHKVRRTQIGNY